MPRISTDPRSGNKLSEFDKAMMGLIHVSKKELLESEKRYKLERKSARKSHKS